MGRDFAGEEEAVAERGIDGLKHPGLHGAFAGGRGRRGGGVGADELQASIWVITQKDIGGEDEGVGPFQAFEPADEEDRAVSGWRGEGFGNTDDQGKDFNGLIEGQRYAGLAHHGIGGGAAGVGEDDRCAFDGVDGEILRGGRLIVAAAIDGGAGVDVRDDGGAVGVMRESPEKGKCQAFVFGTFDDIEWRGAVFRQNGVSEKRAHGEAVHWLAAGGDCCRRFRAGRTVGDSSCQVGDEVHRNIGRQGGLSIFGKGKGEEVDVVAGGGECCGGGEGVAADAAHAGSGELVGEEGDAHRGSIICF